MKTIKECRSLAGEITSYFKDGITLDSHAKGYITACFPDMPLQDLVDRICDKPGFDDAPLMELIFFPDEALQLRLEPLLEKAVFSDADQNEVTRLLLEADIRTTLREAGSNAFVSVKIPAPVLAPFVRRLKISRHTPQQLIDTIRNKIPTAETTRLKVRLRNARFAFSRQVTGFLDRFFRGINPAAGYFRDCCDLVLAVLDEQKNEPNPYLLPKAKLDMFIRAKTAAIQFNDQLLRGNMETLMHRGIRAPEISIEDAERKIELLKRMIAATKPGKHLV